MHSAMAIICTPLGWSGVVSYKMLLWRRVLLSLDLLLQQFQRPRRAVALVHAIVIPCITGHVSRVTLERGNTNRFEPGFETMFCYF